MVLTLSDFDTAGLDVDFLALIERNDGTVGVDSRIWYQTNAYGTAAGDLLAGELGLGDDEVVIERIRTNSNTHLRFNDRDMPIELSLGSYFTGDGAGVGQTLWLVSEQDDGALLERSIIISSSNVVSSGGGFVNFSFGTNQLGAVLDDVAAGERFIVALTRESEGGTTDYIGDLNPVGFTFVVPNVEGEHRQAHSGELDPVTFTFDVPNVEGRKTGSHIGNLDPVIWSFDTPNVDGSRATSHQGDLDPIAWSFVTPDVEGSKSTDHQGGLDPVTWSFDIPAIMKAPYSTAIFTIEADWARDGQFNHAQSNVSGDVVEMHLVRGRATRSQIPWKATAGRASFRVRNRNGKYSRANTSGPLSGVLKPGVPIRVRTTDPVGTLWQGVLSDLGGETELTPGQERILTLTASGPLWQLKSAGPVTVQPQRGILIGDALEAVLDQINWPSSARDIDDGQLSLTHWWVDEQDALDALRDLEETDRGFLYESADGKVVYEDSHHRLGLDFKDPVATFSDADGATNPYAGVAPYDVAEQIFNEATIQVRSFTERDEAVVWTFGGGTPVLEPSQTLTLTAVYPPPGVSEGRYVSSWVMPVVGTDILQTGGDDSDLSVSIETTSRTLKLSIENTGSDTVFITRMQARGTAVVENEITEVTANVDVTDSQDAYGTRPLPLTGRWHQSLLLAQLTADYLIDGYKEPRTPTPVMMRLQGHRSANIRTQLVGRDISDRVTVEAMNTDNPGAQLGIDGDYFIERIEHHVVLAGDWNARMLLSPAGAFTDYWIAGETGYSELGQTTELAPP